MTITEPKVTLIAITKFLGMPQEVPWEPEMCCPGTQALIEASGRACYESWHNPSGRTNEEYILNLLRQGHLSVLEHASATFYLRGVSRSLTHELVRHRHLSYSQRSQRYVDEADCGVVVPPALLNDPVAIAALERHAEECRKTYEGLLDRLQQSMPDTLPPVEKRKVARQTARSVLPNATETRIVVSGNFRAWRWFLKKRCDRHADSEIRRVALRILEELQREAPAVFGDFKVFYPETGEGNYAEPAYDCA